MVTWMLSNAPSWTVKAWVIESQTPTANWLFLVAPDFRGRAHVTSILDPPWPTRLLCSTHRSPMFTAHSRARDLCQMTWAKGWSGVLSAVKYRHINMTFAINSFLCMTHHTTLCSSLIFSSTPYVRGGFRSRNPRTHSCSFPSIVAYTKWYSILITVPARICLAVPLNVFGNTARKIDQRANKSIHPLDKFQG